MLKEMSTLSFDPENEYEIVDKKVREDTSKIDGTLKKLNVKTLALENDVQNLEKSIVRYYILSDELNKIYEIPNNTTFTKIKDGTAFNECFVSGKYSKKLVNLSAIENISSGMDKVFLLSNGNLLVGQIKTMQETSYDFFWVELFRTSYSISGFYPLEA